MRGSRKRPFPTKLRFWSKVQFTSDCWIWKAAVFDDRGYGKFPLTPTKLVRAHRYAFEIGNGPIPEGQIVCHKCDNPSCVKPDHLFLGTYKDNAQDRDKKGRAGVRRGELNPMAKVTTEDVHKIRKLYNHKICSQRVLGILFNVSQGTIHNIVREKEWRHV